MTKQTCKICSNEVDYCGACAVVKDTFQNAGYCDEDCYHISMIIQQYIGKVITADEAMKELEKHNISNKTLNDGIQKRYEQLKKECSPKKEEASIKEANKVDIPNEEKRDEQKNSSYTSSFKKFKK